MPVGLLSPPRYGEQRCPLVACSDVIGSNVTNVLVWKRQLTASPLPQPLAGGGAHALRAWHAAAVEKKRTAGVAVRRLVLAPRRVDWPAQPSLDLAHRNIAALKQRMNHVGLYVVRAFRTVGLAI